MAKKEAPNPVLDMLKKSAQTGGGPRTTMPIEAWLSELKRDGLFAVPTFHGRKGDNQGYRSGEIHTQLRNYLKKYAWVYRVPANEKQTYMFVGVDTAIFVQADIPVEQVATWGMK